jgi:predicted nucleic acid-binding protein
VAAGELMRSSDLQSEIVEDPEHGYAAAITASGRISVARVRQPARPELPFTPVQLARLDEALTLSSRATGLRFGIYLGDLGADTRATAESLHATSGDVATDTVLIAVSPGQRKVEIVTGDEAFRRLPDRACNLAVMSMVASFKEGDLTGGLVSALRMLSDQAGRSPR